MLAVLLTISIFGYLWLVGASIGFACVRRRWLLQTLLLAPSIGFSAVITTIVSANYLGLPIEDLAVPLVLIFGVLSVVSLWVFRPTFPWRQYAPYAAILAVAFLLNSIPFVLFGFNWVSFSNGDATTYALNAYRLMHYGYWSLPPASDLLLNSIPSSLMYYHYDQFPGGFYHGFDVMLSVVSQLTGLNPYEVYMPVMAAGLVSLTSAAGALLLYRGFPRSAPIVACLAGGLSSQATLGYVYQLGPQELGLTMFVASVALLTNVRVYTWRGWTLIGYAVLAGLALAGLNTTYNAFHFVLPPVLVAFLALHVVRREIRWMDALWFAATVALFTGVFTNVNSEALTSSVRFSLSFRGGQQIGGANVFPFYLVPSGLANFWGLYPIAHPPPEPLLSIGIAFGAVLLAFAAVVAFLLAWRGLGPAIAAAVMFGMSGIAAVTHNGFALFKLSMYIEPFLWVTVSAACFRFVRAVPAWRTCTRRNQFAIAASPIVLLGLLALNAQQFYISRSEDLSGSDDQSFVSLPHASDTRLLAQLSDIRKTLDSEPVLMDTDSPALGAYEGFYLYGRPNFEPSLPARKLDAVHPYVGDRAELGRIRWSPRAAENLARLGDMFRNAEFALEPARARGKTDTFQWYRIRDLLPDGTEPTMILTTTPQQTVLNRSHARGQRRDAILVPRDRISNHLILLNASLGSNDGNELLRNATLYRVQEDFFNGGQTYSAVGRYLLFYIIKPTKSFRFVLDLTASLNADGVNALPPAAAVGSSRVRFDSVGRGSARLFSPPISPQMLRGNAYAAIDMGKDGSRYPNRKTGLMRLYGLNYGGDLRRIVGFARNISVISEDEYRSKVEPPMLASFPRDLNNEALEFSGIYDDGWVSKTSYAILRARGRSHVDVAGVVPEVNDPGFRTEARVSVDGQEIDREPLGPGPFTLSAGDIAPGRHRLSVHFSREQALPHGDRRLVVGLLSKYGFVQGKAEMSALRRAASVPIVTDIPVASHIELGPEWGVPEHYAGKVFRWCAGEATIRIGPAIRHVTLALEPGPGVSRLPLRLDVTDARDHVEAAFSVAGYERVTIPLSKAHGTILRVRAENGGGHIASDPRVLDFRVFSVNAN